eukprot:5734763-Prymnesium_polylepis.1
MPAAAVAISHAATSRSATRTPARSPPQRQHRARCVSRNITHSRAELSAVTHKLPRAPVVPTATLPYHFQPCRPKKQHSVEEVPGLLPSCDPGDG